MDEMAFDSGHPVSILITLLASRRFIMMVLACHVLLSIGPVKDPISLSCLLIKKYVVCEYELP